MYMYLDSIETKLATIVFFKSIYVSIASRKFDTVPV